MSSIESFVNEVRNELSGSWQTDPIHLEKTNGMETSLTRESDQLSIIIGYTAELQEENKVYVQMPKEVYGVPDRPNQRDHTLEMNSVTVARHIEKYDPAEDE
jgi:hypothetical protein